MVCRPRCPRSLFDAAGLRLAAGDALGRVWLWEQGGKAHRDDRQDHRGAVLAVGFGDKGKAIVSVDGEGQAICRKTNSDEVLSETRVSTSQLTSAAISQDGTTLVTLGRQVTVWNALAADAPQRRSHPGQPPQHGRRLAIRRCGHYRSSLGNIDV